jgi:acyl-coenzyme A synthetase/AMP-(fatty) acid ligase
MEQTDFGRGSGPTLPEAFTPADGDTDIKAIVVLTAGSSPDEAGLHRHCDSNLARVMVPQIIEVRESLPYTEIGKLDRSALLVVTGRIIARPPR